MTNNDIREIRKAIRPNWNFQRTAKYTVEKDKGIESEFFKDKKEDINIKEHPHFYLIDLLNPQKISEFNLTKINPDEDHDKDFPMNGFFYMYKHNIENIEIINRVFANRIQSNYQTEIYIPSINKPTELEQKILNHYDKIYSIK